MLSGVNYRNLTVQGSDFKKAISMGINRFIGDKKRNKALVFISDGGDTGDNVGINITRTKNISFAVVGIGTEKGGKIIKGQDFFGRAIYQKYKGKIVISKLHLDNLEEIANSLGTDVFKVRKYMRFI
ncbi:MAG: hypothetical protein Q9M97_00730 [Candidatus Gracilibacteria bacterium]|nr:hypothetical protein [Candidatus Gracilibacteria bacterium]